MSQMTAPTPKWTDNRDAARRLVTLPATLRQEFMPLDIEIMDISATGFQARSATTIAIGRKVTVGAVGIGVVEAEVIWANAPFYGFRIDTDLSPAVVHSICAANNVEIFPVQPLPVQAATLTEMQPGIGGIIGSVALATGAVLGALFGSARID